MYLPLDLRKKIAPILAKAEPRSPQCTICGVPHEFSGLHTVRFVWTDVSHGDRIERETGISAICEDCHNELPKADRLMGYLTRVRQWEAQGMDPERVWRFWLPLVDAVILEGTPWEKEAE